MDPAVVNVTSSRLFGRRRGLKIAVFEVPKQPTETSLHVFLLALIFNISEVARHAPRSALQIVKALDFSFIRHTNISLDEELKLTVCGRTMTYPSGICHTLLSLMSDDQHRTVRDF